MELNEGFKKLHKERTQLQRLSKLSQELKTYKQELDMLSKLKQNLLIRSASCQAFIFWGCN